MVVSAIVPGDLVTLTPMVRRITAPNPGVMTRPGTNTYLIGESDIALIDPGPEIDSHRDAILGAAGGRLRWILCTHTHLDHSPLARALREATGAEVLGRPAPQDGRQDAGFAPQRVLEHGDIVDCGTFRLRAVHTPGHASNHVCYLLEGHGLLFTGDHIMQGSTVVISPPDGDMKAYLRSLELLLGMELEQLAPGHGHLISSPHDEVRKVIAHCLKRESRVIEAFARRFGRAPTHLDSHHHAHRVPRVMDAVVDVALGARLPLRSQDAGFRDGLRRLDVATTDHFVGDAQSEPYWTSERLLDQLAVLPLGLTELMCHPGVFDDDLAYSRYGRQRETELAALCDPEARATIERLDIRLCHFGALDAPG